jgi:hypothetical protein
MTVLDLEQIERALDHTVRSDVFIHFTGLPGEGTDLPLRVTPQYFIDVFGALEALRGHEEPSDGPVALGVTMEDPSVTLLPAAKVEFQLTNWAYMSLLAEASVNHFQVVPH